MRSSFKKKFLKSVRVPKGLQHKEIQNRKGHQNLSQGQLHRGPRLLEDEGRKCFSNLSSGVLLLSQGKAANGFRGTMETRKVSKSPLVISLAL